MKISLSPIQYFDLAGVPLAAGRIKVFLHGSDTLAPVFVMDGENFIAGQNPLVLDGAGEQHNTLFMEAAIYDIWVEKNVEGTYVKISDFQFGFNPDAVKNDTIVTDMAGLAEANPALGTVTVVGYASGNDCGPRTYIWDPSCTDDEDGCCIVRGNTEDGRWLLLSDSRYLPSNWYGIVPGVNEANLSAFLTYPKRAGQWGIVFPPVPRFLPGTYTTPGSVSVTKTIAFDPGAKFTRIRFTCYAAEITASTDYVADFQFIKQSYAESAWFRTARCFWQCGAAELHQSRTNYFESVDMGVSGLGIAHQRISGTPFAMTGTGYLLITDCDIAPRSLSTSWYIIFQSMSISDRWFADANWDIGYYTQGHHTQANTVAGCSFTPDNFDNINVMVLMLAYQGVTTLDLGGKSMGTLSASMPFTAIQNGSIQEAHFSKATALDHVRVYSLHAEAAGKMISATNSVINVSATAAGQFIFDDCTVAFNASLDTLATAVTALRSIITLNSPWMYSNPANHLNSQSLNLIDTIFNNGEIQGTNIVARRCDFNNTVVRNVPGGIPGSYTLSTRIENCHFGGTAYLALTPGVDDSNAMDVFEVAVGYIKITGNSFLTSAQYGIRMPFWAQDMEHRFIGGVTTYAAPGDPSVAHDGVDFYPLPYIYADNYGNCPRQFGTVTKSNGDSVIAMVTGWGANTGDGSAMRFMSQTPCSVFAFPAVVNSTQDPLPEVTVTGEGIYTAGVFAVTIPYRAKSIVTFDGNTGGCCLDYPIMGYIPVCAYDKSMPNDMFNSLVGSWSIYSQFCGMNPIAPGQ